MVKNRLKFTLMASLMNIHSELPQVQPTLTNQFNKEEISNQTKLIPQYKFLLENICIETVGHIKPNHKYLFPNYENSLPNFSNLPSHIQEQLPKYSDMCEESINELNLLLNKHFKTLLFYIPENSKIDSNKTYNI